MRESRIAGEQFDSAGDGDAGDRGIADGGGVEGADPFVAAADALLAEKGLEGLTIRAVLERTALARRAFYSRFAGKDDLVLAVFSATLRGAAEHFADHGRTLADPLERLRYIIMRMVMGRLAEGEGSERRSAALSREHLRLGESRPEELQQALRPLLVEIARQLADGMEAGQVRRTDPDRLAELVYNLVSTTAHAVQLGRDGASRDTESRRQLAEDVWDFCRRALVP